MTGRKPSPSMAGCLGALLTVVVALAILLVVGQR